MYHHLKSLKNNFSNNHLFSFFYCLFLTCVIYGCNTQNRSNVGDNTVTSKFVTCQGLSNINGEIKLKIDQCGNTDMHLACQNGNKECVIQVLSNLFSLKRKEYINEIFNIENNDGLTCIDLASVNGHIDLLDNMFELLKTNNCKINEVTLERSVRFLEGNHACTRKIKKKAIILLAIEKINDYIKNHIKITNEGQKSDPCRICGKVSTQKSSLNKHIKTLHEGQKSDPCPRFGKVFTHKGNLKKHIKKKHSNYVAASEHIRKKRETV